MADTLTRRSALPDWQTRFAALPETAQLSAEPFTTMVDLWVDPQNTGGRAAAQVCGLAALPTSPSTETGASGVRVIWFGPQEWLVTSERDAGADLEARLRAAVADHGGAAVDVSAQRITLRLRGRHARDVLAKGCSLDLHPSAFGPGAVASTMLARANVVLIPLAGDGSDYHILVRTSFARYLAEWLVDAAQEFAHPR